MWYNRSGMGHNWRWAYPEYPRPRDPWDVIYGGCKRCGGDLYWDVEFEEWACLRCGDR